MGYRGDTPPVVSGLEPPTTWDQKDAKEQFLEEESRRYGFDLNDAEFQKQVQREYPAFTGTTYLDFSAAPPPPLSTISAVSLDLAQTLYSNPHSDSATSDKIDQVRGRVLEELFGLKSAALRAEWDLIWTANASAGLKLVGEAFNWEEGSSYCYVKEAHTSLVGIRGCALARGGRVEVLEVNECEAMRGKGTETLFGVSAQCGATGARLGLGFVAGIKRHNPDALVCLDAAAYLATNVLDLSSIPLSLAPDFVACSFYKIFGYPSGLGALIVKRSSGEFLEHKSYFGGGAVDGLSLGSPYLTHPRQPPASFATFPEIHQRFEDGTLPFLNIIALNLSLDVHRKLYKSHAHVSQHTLSLRTFASSQLSQLRHANGRPVVRQYLSFRGAKNHEDPGPAVGFSLVDADGNLVGHTELDRMAKLNGFVLRAGGLCNVGAISNAVGLTDEHLKQEFARGRRCWDDEEFVDASIDEKRIPLGIARISFGAASTIDHLLDFIAFLRRYFVMSSEIVSLLRPTLSATPPSASARLETLTLYPIKSCGGIEVPEWEITRSGLFLDREWTLVNASTGIALSQKRFPKMALIRPVVDLANNILRVSARGSDLDELVIPFPFSRGDGDILDVRLCGEVVKVVPTDPQANSWFSEFLGVDCLFSRISTEGARHGHFPNSKSIVPIHLSNESPFLLISTPSVNQINSWILSSPSNDDPSPSRTLVQPSCFRANFVLSPLSASSPLPPFFEDKIDVVRIGTETFQTLAPCRRCLMVCVDQEKGEKHPQNEPFNCLARTRRNGSGRINFGVHLMWKEGQVEGGVKRVVRKGDLVTFIYSTGSEG